MTPKILIFILILLTVINEWRTGYFRHFFAPLRNLRFKTAALYFALTAGSLFILFFLDPFLVPPIQKLTGSFEGIVTFGRTIGKNNYFWYTLLVLYLIPLILRKSALRRYTFSIIVSSGVTAVFITILKFIFLRARPTVNTGSLSFFNSGGLTGDMSEFQSFPSGDVSLVAGASLYLFFAIPNIWIRWVFLILPLTTALARIHLNRHWPSDTLGSIFIAFFIGMWIYEHARGGAAGKEAKL